MVLSYGQNKTKYDLSPHSLAKSSALKTVSSEDSKELKDSLVSATMIDEGYFTIGTNKGLSNSKWDDNCQITYGHPYALTSFPVFSVDGNWFKPEDYFTFPQVLSANKTVDTLFITSGNNNKISFSFYLINNGSGEIKLIEKIINIDTASHKISLGLFFDPALGKWGDGKLEIANSFIENSSQYLDSQVPSNFSIWEKETGNKGIGIDLNFNNSIPNNFLAANWNETHSVLAPDFGSNLTQSLYDLYLKFYWNEKSLSPNQSTESEVTIKLKQPDFSSPLFVRWDLPNFLDMSNNVMFPKNFATYLDVNSQSNSGSNYQLSISTGSDLTSTLSNPTITTDGTGETFKLVNFNAHDIYENKVIDVSAKITDGTNTIDEIHRNVFIPGTPVSDTGLVVSVDTIMTSNYPTVGAIFNVKMKANDYYITNLNSDNIFLYDNQNRINQFNLMKDTTGGVDAVDIVFALDVTGSMGNVINAVKNNILEFADTLTTKGVDYRLGMVTFLDQVENIYPFTNDASYFQSLVAQQYAHGGDDAPENSLQALMDASQYDFRPSAKHIVIWITDINYHEADNITQLTKQVVIDSLLTKDITVDAVGTITYKQGSYDPIIIPTGGNYYNINGNFRDIFLDISNLKQTNKYLLSFQVLNASEVQHNITIDIKYAGLGGNTVFQFDKGSQQKIENYLSFYPNPFNPEITFNVQKRDYKNGSLRIYNLLGQCVRSINLGQNNFDHIVWNARNNHGEIVSTGFYIVQLVLHDNAGKQYSESAKIMYLK